MIESLIYLVLAIAVAIVVLGAIRYLVQAAPFLDAQAKQWADWLLLVVLVLIVILLLLRLIGFIPSLGLGRY
jgi:hypothetical protein